MRIATTRIEDFIENLKTGTVYGGRVYYERSEMALGDKPRRDATSLAVVYQASAVVVFPDGAEALVVCGIDCGIDRTTGDGGLDGSRKWDEVHCELKQFCSEVHVSLLPGVLDQ